MVEGARLESVYTVIPYRGFESLSLRQPSLATCPAANAGHAIALTRRFLSEKMRRALLHLEGKNPNPAAIAERGVFPAGSNTLKCYLMVVLWSVPRRETRDKESPVDARGSWCRA